MYRKIKSTLCLLFRNWEVSIYFQRGNKSEEGTKQNIQFGDCVSA